VDKNQSGITYHTSKLVFKVLDDEVV